MASNGGDARLNSGKDEMDCAQTTVEIKIKTLDSQTYTMRVDKCVPVPALKEQIALVTGVLSEQQRLICRGKVLKDDQLLSAYHVEDGHTLHLVVRQPVAPSSESTPNPDNDPVSTSGRGRGPGIVVGSFNISEQDGDLSTSRVISALLGSLGMANFGSGLEGLDLNELPSERLSNPAGQRNLSRQRPDVTVSGQPFVSSGAFSLPIADSVESLQAPVIPDSLTTLTQNLIRLRQEFIANVEGQSHPSPGAGIQGTGGQNSDAPSISSVQRGLPTPASLADVLQTTRQFLNEQVSECLLQLARQLEGHGNVTDTSERARIQNNALRSGALFHNLGALLLELARTTITLRMGQTPADGIVNAGPAVFISPTGPNPIMVQPLPFQTGIGFGASGGTVQQNSGFSPGSGRTIDIRIRRVAVPSGANRRDATRSQNTGQTDSAASNNASAAQGGTRVSGGSSAGESEMRLFPIRTVYAAIPANGGQAASEPSRGSMGILFPLLARVQRVATTGSAGETRAATQASNQPPNASGVDPGSQSNPAPVVELQNLGTYGVDGSEQVDASGSTAQLLSRIEQWLRVVLPGEQQHNQNAQGTEANMVSGRDVNAEDENSGGAAAATVSEEGAFLSSMLQQLMPLISGDVQNSRGTEGDVDRGGSSSRRQEDSSSMQQPEAKRQKRD